MKFALIAFVILSSICVLSGVYAIHLEDNVHSSREPSTKVHLYMCYLSVSVCEIAHLSLSLCVCVYEERACFV